MFVRVRMDVSLSLLSVINDRWVDQVAAAGSGA